MIIYELKYKVFLLLPVKQEDALVRIASCIDRTLLKSARWGEFHSENRYKGYSFCAPYPLSEGGYYREHQVYQILIRTVLPDLADYLAKSLPEYEDVCMKGLICEMKEIQKFHVSSMYSITPVIVKGEKNQYWRDNMDFLEFERQIKNNLIKKYKAFYQEELEENFELYSYIELKNRMPIKICYKKIHLLGGKVQLQITEHPSAQKLAFMAYAAGIGTMNQRGYGFVNVKR